MFLAGLILAFHSTGHFGCSYGAIDGFVNMGAMAMTGFFLLSGYSNYYAYSAWDFSDIRAIQRFYLKRLTGIVPVYYFGALMYIIIWGKESLSQNLLLAPIELLGIQNVFYGTFRLTHNGGTWFISCILICYFAFPYLSGIVGQLSAKRNTLFIGMLTMILLYAPFAVHFFALGSIYDNPFMRGFEFTIGIALASLKEECGRFGMLAKPIALALELLILIAGVEVAWRLGIARGNYMLYSWIGLPVFMCMTITAAGMEMKANKAISYLSAISYSFFIVQLFNWPIMRKIVGWIGIDGNMFRIASSFTVSLLLAVGIHELIEKPSKKLFGRLIE